MTRHNEPWWVLADVCKVLEIAKPDRAATRLDADEKGAHTVRTLGELQSVTTVNERGLYSLILTSRSSVDHLWEVMAIIDGCNIQGEPSRDSWEAAFPFPCVTSWRG
ncbi:BRO-N domain-containing protein [Acetobacter senegalensis]|uniref:BRO-N domain-containing protein n=1 Tax=Acetobacter senegalensis TaxID=446692 RepID=UPI0029C9C1B1|nr:Bro-N domain-containing protein [Acetobacter senegalensis]